MRLNTSLLNALLGSGKRDLQSSPTYLLDPAMVVVLVQCTANARKADVAERPKVFRHVGLLVNGPPGRTGVPLI
jgi:hypothetical protein